MSKLGDIIVSLYRWGGGQKYLQNYLSVTVTFEYTTASTIQIKLPYSEWPTDVFPKPPNKSTMYYDYWIVLSGLLFQRVKYYRVSQIYADIGGTSGSTITITGVSPLYDLNTVRLTDKEIAADSTLLAASNGEYQGTASSVISSYIKAAAPKLYLGVDTTYSYGVYSSVIREPIAPWLDFDVQDDTKKRYDYLGKTQYDNWMASNHKIYRTVGGKGFVDDVNTMCEDFVDTTSMDRAKMPFLVFARTSSAYDILPDGTWQCCVDRPYLIAQEMRWALEYDENIPRRIIIQPASPPGTTMLDVPVLDHVEKADDTTWRYYWVGETFTDTNVTNSYRPFSGSNRNNKVVRYEEFEPSFKGVIDKQKSGTSMLPGGAGLWSPTSYSRSCAEARNWAKSGFYSNRYRVEYHLPDNYLLSKDWRYDGAFRVRDICTTTGNSCIEKVVYTFDDKVNMDLTVSYG